MTDTPDAPRRTLVDLALAAAESAAGECAACGCHDIRRVDGRTVCRFCGRPVLSTREPR